MSTLSNTGVPGFEVACASIAGAAHARRGRNNQDGLAVRAGPASLCAVVCDGCGSGQATEVGAMLAAQLLAARLLEQTPPLGTATSDSLAAGLATATAALLADLGRLLARLPGERPVVIEDHFLFTIVGLWLTSEQTCLFALGDGVWGLNGALHQLGPFAGNAPPYLGYHLLDTVGGATPPRLAVLTSLPTAEVETLLIATDGAIPLIADRPPSEALAGELNALQRDPLTFANPDALRRRLWRLSRTAGHHGSPALLDDDTTLVVIRRRGEEVR